MTETAPPANSPAGAPLSASVAVVTYERPTFVARCLEQLLVQTQPPVEIIVVDSSTSDDTARLVRERFPTVAYEVCPAGRGATATARNISYRLATGDVLAFIDDDAFAERDWLENLLAQFADPAVGGVGGRQIRKQPGELVEGVDAIGLLLEDGTLTGNFAADPGRSLPVDHLLGANMAFRRSVIESLGGIRDGYAGTCIREETDLCLRVAHAGYRLTYTPDAVVEHVAAPYAKGERFDLRYAYWAQKNHLILLIRNFGLTRPIVRRYLSRSLGEAVRDGRTRLARAWSRAHDRDGVGALRAAGAALSRTAVLLAGSMSGLASGARLAGEDRRSQAAAER
ncbi:MAG TPA: glycosyltransferase family 2 protein [Acidimicrobiales bacterium]|nr:glycosyltransferase family 2 protein [Acidimicrobiales bacterium]